MTDLTQVDEHVAALERRLESERVRRDGWTLGVMAFAAIALLSASSRGPRPQDDEAAAAAVAVEAAPRRSRSSSATSSCEPSSIEVAAGTELILEVTNDGAMAARPQARRRDRHRHARPGRDRDGRASA